MPTECTTKLFEFEAVERRAVVASFDGGDITSNAGGLLLGQVDRGLGLVRRFARCFSDRRDPRYVEHRVETLVGQRIFGLVLGYEDLNDHDELRKDPTFTALAGKLEPVLRSDCEALAGKSTLNRLEHTPKRHGAKYHKIDCDGAQVDTLLVDLFLEAHERPPREIVLDLDNTDIPLHGMQEGRFYHGHYEEYCYLPLYVFCGRHLLLARQRRANVAGSDGAVEEVARIVAQIRQTWPRVQITLRADSGFCNDPMMRWCEANRVDYVFGPAPISASTPCGWSAPASGMWYLGTLWKLPLPISAGFKYWLENTVKYSSFQAHASIMQVFLDHIALVQPLVFLLETALAISLMLGIAVRLAGIVGVLFILNLLIGLYNDPTEWPWTYVGIICAHGMFAVAQAGRSLGIDNLLAKRLIPGLPYDGAVARAISVAT